MSPAILFELLIIRCMPSLPMEPTIRANVLTERQHWKTQDNALKVKRDVS